MNEIYLFDKNYLNHSFVSNDNRPRLDDNKDGFWSRLDDNKDGFWYICDACGVGIIYWKKDNKYFVENECSFKMFNALLGVLNLSCEEMIIKQIIE